MSPPPSRTPLLPPPNARRRTAAGVVDERQLALPWLDAVACAPLPPPAPPRLRPPAPVPVPVSVPVSVPAVAPSAVPVPQSAAPASAGPDRLLRPPQANREILLGGHRVGYVLRRARRRTIGFIVGEDGLAVAAPRWVSLGEIEQALQSKAAWVLRKLADQHSRRERLQAARVDWREGTELPWLGATLVVMLDARLTGAQLDARLTGTQLGAQAAPLVDLLPPRGARLTLRVGLPATAEPAQIRDAVQGWLQRQALALFQARCAVYAQRLGVTIRRLRLSSAQTRWGSASADGTVRLNWRLVHFPPATVDYVVAHELAHLHEMNHSPAFWQVVRSVMPDYEQHRGALKDGQVPIFD